MTNKITGQTQETDGTETFQKILYDFFSGKNGIGGANSKFQCRIYRLQIIDFGLKLQILKKKPTNPIFTVQINKRNTR